MCPCVFKAKGRKWNLKEEKKHWKQNKGSEGGGDQGQWGANLPGRDSGRWDHSEPWGAERRELPRLAEAWTRPRPRGRNGRIGGRGDGRGGGGGGGGGVGEVWKVEVGVLGLQHPSVQTEGSVMVKAIGQLKAGWWGRGRKTCWHENVMMHRSGGGGATCRRSSSAAFYRVNKS